MFICSTVQMSSTDLQCVYQTYVSIHRRRYSCSRHRTRRCTLLGIVRWFSSYTHQPRHSLGYLRCTYPNCHESASQVLSREQRRTGTRSRGVYRLQVSGSVDKYFIRFWGTIIAHIIRYVVISMVLTPFLYITLVIAEPPK